MDSTKKVTKKLAGAAANTAGWCTNIGNEHGQVLVSVLTAAEGHGLWPMAAGLMRRYREAGVAPPAIMYVDRDCCSPHGQSQVRAMFAEWRELQVRLDIWHFMRRFAAGVTTEAHQLYGVFMAGLSRCIFELDPADVAALRLAKQGQLLAQGVGPVSEKALDQMITRRELALHCRKRTRGAEETARRIKALVDEMDSEKGRDTLGVPLVDHERIQQVWKDQQRHITCIQDPEGFSLYLKTGRPWTDLAARSSRGPWTSATSLLGHIQARMINLSSDVLAEEKTVLVVSLEMHPWFSDADVFPPTNTDMQR
ncbi:uncharacterized protein LOC118560170 isoform X1 [Fundulus heteroclitus]|uniref:uncharacterized protein LOC118560170 isoform X1 n=1 Tax=Fundulus heteroclitus TaxID=8078 RepID=UPI00165A5CA4|nr:uncharacterized protein LOC118560170 isoform X1 [Fundulus heteroclitus]